MLKSPGYKVECAVGLTYSLNFDTLLSVMISFGFLGDSEDFPNLSPACLMGAIQKNCDKIAVFCNSGSIAQPSNRKIYPLLENCIFPINKKNASFHPKLWAIQEVNAEGERRIKLVVLSRNLTFDSSLDTVVTLTGHVTGKTNNHKQSKYLPIIKLLEETATYCNQKKKDLIKKLCKEISKVNEFLVDNPFDDYQFYTENLMKIKTEMQGDDMIVFSPFIDRQTIKWLFDNTKKNRLLVTRRESVSDNIESYDLKDMLTKKQIYVPNKLLENSDYAPLNLHAKMYFVSKKGNKKSENNLFVGSANATDRAFNRNTEILLRLHYKSNKSSFKSFKKYMVEESNQFEPIDDISSFKDQKELSTKEEIAFRIILDRIDKASVKKEGDKYKITILFKPDKKKDFSGINCSIAPLQAPQNKSKAFKNIPPKIILHGVSLEDLSEFYILKVGALTPTVIKIQTNGFNDDDRDDAIFKNIVKSPTEFINYLSFFFSDNPQNPIPPKTKGTKQKGNSSNEAESILYEDMLRSFYNDPRKFEIVKREINIIDGFNKNVVPKQIKTMLESFSKAYEEWRKNA